MRETTNCCRAGIASVSAAAREARHCAHHGAVHYLFAPRDMHPSLLSELRKRQALHLVEQGYSSRDVAQRLGLAETTVQRLRQGRIPLEVDHDDDERRQRVWCARCRCHVFAPCQRCRLREYQRQQTTSDGRSTAATVPSAGRLAGQAADPRLSLGVAQLGLPVRTVNYLARADILTVWDLLQRTPQQILKLPNMGPRTLELIFAALARLGFHRQGMSQDESASIKKADRRSRRHEPVARRRKQRGLIRRGSARAADARPPARQPRKSHRPR